MTVYKLKSPVTIANSTYVELRLRPLRFGDAEALFGAKNELHAMRILLGRIADVPNEVIENLDLQDVADLLGELALAITVPIPVRSN